MKRSSTIRLAFAAVLALAGLARPAAAATSCDRACLRDIATTYLEALVAHAPGRLPVAPDVRFTENSNRAKLGEGLWNTAGPLTPYRQDYIDVRLGVIGTHAVIEDGGRPTLLAVRLKVVDRRITEIETQTTHDAKEGALFNLATLKTADPRMNVVPPAGRKASREDLIRIANLYPAGLQAGSFLSVDLPVAADTDRIENGVITAGPSCTRNPECKVVKTQPLGPGRVAFSQRLLAVDEELGIVWLRLSWARPEGTRLVAYEAFKIYDGQIRAIEAFMRFNPLDQPSGWE